MCLGSIALPIFVCVGWVVAVAPPVPRQETTMFLFGPPTTFDWWPFDDLETSLVPRPSFTPTGLSQSPATSTPPTSFTSSSPLSHPSPSPSIIDITALPPAATNSPHPRMRMKQTLNPAYLAPVFGLVGLLPGVLVGWLVSKSYQRWVTKRAAVPLLPGPAYVPVERVDEWTDGDRGGTTGDVEGSPSKHTRHGTTYSSYSVGKALLGRIPSSRFYKPLPIITQERADSASSERSFAWPSLPSSSRPTPSHSRATTISTKSTQTPTMTPDDPFMSTENTSTGTNTKSHSAVVASRTSTRSTFAHSSRFGEMWSGDEEDQDPAVASPFSPTYPAGGEGEIRTGPLKIRSKSKSAKGKKRDETNELPSPASEISSRKSSWNLPWITGSPPVKPDSYTILPARTVSPRSQSFRTPESSPRKPSYVRSIERARIVDTSVLPASPPTLTSPRLESELFLSAMMFDVPGTPTPKRTRSSRPGTGLRKGTGVLDMDTLDAISPPPPHFRGFEPSDESHTTPKRGSRPGPGRHPSTASTISEFPGDAPRKRTPAERFYARHSALDKVEEIVQKSRSQTSVASASMSPVTFGTGEDKRSGHLGREFKRSGIEQRLFES